MGLGKWASVPLPPRRAIFFPPCPLSSLGLQPSDAATVEQLSEESRLPQAAVAATTAPRPFQLPSWFYAALGLLSWVGAIVAYRKHQSQAVATGASVPPLAMLATAGQSEGSLVGGAGVPCSLWGSISAPGAHRASLFDHSPPGPVFASPHQTILSTFAPCLPPLPLAQHIQWMHQTPQPSTQQADVC